MCSLSIVLHSDNKSQYEDMVSAYTQVVLSKSNNYSDLFLNELMKNQKNGLGNIYLLEDFEEE